MVRLINVYTISSFIALGGFLAGLDISSMNAIVGTPEYRAYYNNPLGARQGGITGAIAAGSFAGALCSSLLGDWLSRKVAIQLGTVVWCAGASLQSASNGVAMLIVGRIVAGFCIGLTSTLIPIYQSEIAPRKVRGRIVTLYHFGISVGILVMYFVQYGCSFLNSQAVFRLPWALQTIPAILLFFGLLSLPRSPRWLASKDRWDQVLHVLALLRTPDCNINDNLVLAEYREIEEQIRIEREEHSNSYSELFSKKMRKRVFLGMAVQGFSQLTGVILQLNFTVYVLDSANIPNLLLATSFQYIIFLIATIPTLLWTDQWGRRPSLLIGSLCLAFWWYLEGFIYARFGQPYPYPDKPYNWTIVDHPAASRAIQVCVYLGPASFAMTWGPVQWIYPSEIVPIRIRAKAVSLSTATNWVTSFALLMGIVPLARKISWRNAVFFGCLNVATFICVWFMVPETKQRTLEEMDELFEHGIPAWRSFTGAPYKTSRLDTLAKEIERAKLSMPRVVPVEI
ncbi:general substrate transporter [Lipomyces starkeyi]